MEISLVILAAGMGSRYGGIKQLDRIGPSGETLMEYSVYDAIKVGFNKVVFVIRKDFADEFKELFVDKLKDKVDVELVYQEIDNVPGDISYNIERTKPWGTAHAMLMAKDVVNGPFAVLNADDFYSRESFSIMYNFLKDLQSPGKYEFSMCGYRLANTLSEHGSVSRGICKVSTEGYLESVEEHKEIIKGADGHIYSCHGEEKSKLDPEDLVSMNFWGFTPGIFIHIEKEFASFLRLKGHDVKAEMYIPEIVDDMIRKELARVRVLPSKALWFGVTYAEDKPKTMENIRKLVEKGVYPVNLWA